MISTRTILAAVIAVSITLLPAATGAAATAPVKMTVSGQVGVPCCPADDCKASAACSFKCCAFFAVIFQSFISPPRLFEAAALSADDATLHGLTRSPPTHPPPV